MSQSLLWWATYLPLLLPLAQGPADAAANRSRTLPSRERKTALAALPDMEEIRVARSDRFLVDLDQVRTGHPYKGVRADRPHTGAHIYFRPLKKRLKATDVQRYPAIYAVADGVVTRIDYSFRLREVYVSALKRRVANRRYGIGLAFAQVDGAAVVMHYSIEPFVDPGDAKFYDPFIFVRVGQRVKKGDVIGRMYLPDDPRVAENSHIHFNLLGGRRRHFQSPSIFDERIVRAFHATWDRRRGVDGGVRMPPCMGYRLGRDENPFQRRDVDRL
ncbi:MAG: hypothetical protein VX346_28560 [Planctomycetota bacterium]|nr:hypothetical protein [Planctomycetota bacterium]